MLFECQKIITKFCKISLCTLYSLFCIYFRAESGSSLSSQEDSTLKNGGQNCLTTSVSTNGIVTLSDLERFKQDIILELNKTKQDILNTMRQELAQYFQHKWS